METIYQHPAFSEIIARQEAIMTVQNNPQLVVQKQQNSWLFSLPPDHLRHKPMLLLTIMGIAVKATWQGPIGLYYSAYDGKEDQTQ